MIHSLQSSRRRFAKMLSINQTVLHQGLTPEMDDPSDVRCMRLMSKLSADNLAAYCGDEVKPLPHGHLMIYPTR